jgi:hypothetical protein
MWILLFVGNLISLIMREPCGSVVPTHIGYECGFPFEPRACSQTRTGALQIQEDEDILVSTL